MVLYFIYKAAIIDKILHCDNMHFFLLQIVVLLMLLTIFINYVAPSQSAAKHAALKRKGKDWLARNQSGDMSISVS